MSTLAGLAVRSLWSRRATVTLTVLAIAVSIAMLLGVQKLRHSARDSFASTISGTDLIVGARSGSVNLLLYSVFRIGEPTANVSWKSYRMVAGHRDVAWTIPLLLGDSHRGYRVVGTSDDYFRHYRYAQGRELKFASGRAFTDKHEVVLGSEVARGLDYRTGQAIVVSHGLGNADFAAHAEHPAAVVGILEPTGTPVDQALHLSLESVNELHGIDSTESDAAPGLSAFLVGMRERTGALLMQRALNEYRDEPLQAVIPGVALTRLWSVVGVADRALLLVAACVAVAGLLGMIAAILTSLNERRREMAILRSVGAQPAHVFGLLLMESGLLVVAGMICGIALLYFALFALRPWFAARFGIELPVGGLGPAEWLILGAVMLAALLMSTYPAWRAYRNSLADGLTVRF